MRIRPLALIGLIGVVGGAFGQIRFTEDFSKYATGSNGSPVWTPFAGVWKVASGEYVQTQADYDMGTAYQTPLKFDERFFFEVNFRPLDNYLGAGLFFNMQDQASRNNSQMIRIDEGTLLWGYFDSRGDYQVTGTLGMTLPNGPTRIGVVGNNKTRTYNVLVNGAVVANAQPMEFDRGYIGLDSSGGGHAFSKATLRPPTGKEAAGLGKLPPLTSPISVAVSDEDLVFVTSRSRPPIQVWKRDGKRVTAFGDHLRQPGRIRLLRGIVFVLDTADSTLHTWAFYRNQATAANLPIGPLEKLPGGVIDFDVEPMSTRDDAPARVFALTREKTLYVDRMIGGKWDRPQALKEVSNPTSIAVRGDRLYISDSDYSKARFFIHLYRIAPKTSDVTFEKSISAWLDPRDVFPRADRRLLHLGGLDYYGSVGAVRLIDENGGRVSHTSLFPFKALGKRGALAVARDGTVMVADTAANAVYLLPPDLREPDPVVTNTTSGVQIRWWSPVQSGKGYVRYGVSLDERKWKTAAARWVNGEWAVNLKIGSPGARYHYRFFPVVRMLPEMTPSRVYDFVPAPGAGKRQAAEIRVLCVIYPRSFLDGKTHTQIPEAGLLDKVRKEYEKARLFYWRNSRCRFHLKFVDWVIVRDTEAKVNGGWLPPSTARKDAEPLVAALGKSLADYDSVIATWPGAGFDPSSVDELGAVGGGGLTPYGYSTFAIDGRLGWLVVHEFQHQMDAFYDASGSIKMWLNHPEATIHPGRYGQHFDVNAFIMREWRDDEYLTLRQGRIIEYGDADADGMPDDNPILPMDEKRFGSDAGTADRDRDGLNDLGEFMAGTFSSSDPNDDDTDGDNITDGKDPYPLYALSPQLSPLTSKAGRMVFPYPRRAADEIDPQTEAMRRRFSGGWTDFAAENAGITITAHLDRDFDLEVDVDANNDGWFTGTDNIEIRASTRTGGRARPDGVTTEVTENGPGRTLRVVVSAATLKHTRLVEGQRFGLRVNVRSSKDSYSVFEPWSLFEAEVRESSTTD